MANGLNHSQIKKLEIGSQGESVENSRKSLRALNKTKQTLSNSFKEKNIQIDTIKQTSINLENIKPGNQNKFFK